MDQLAEWNVIITILSIQLTLRFKGGKELVYAHPNIYSNDGYLVSRIPCISPIRQTL
jgi:hypothetical protein